MLNPNANSFVDSRKISIPSVGPRLQKWVFLLIRFKVAREMRLPFQKCGKRNELQASQGGELSFSRNKKRNHKLPLGSKDFTMGKNSNMGRSSHFQNQMRSDNKTSTFKNVERFSMGKNSQHGEELPLSRKKKGNTKLPPFGMSPHPSFIRKT